MYGMNRSDTGIPQHVKSMVGKKIVDVAAGAGHTAFVTKEGGTTHL